VEALEQHCRLQVRTTIGLLVRADDPTGACPQCQGPMHVEKTFTHHGATLEHGHFEVRETVHICARGCRNGDRPLRCRQPELAARLLPRSTVGYDVMTFVGLQRFVEHRQREEIRRELRERYDIALSSGEISGLGQRFLVYLEALHQAHAEPLSVALQADGGWPLHIDATGEDGRGTLLVAYAGWRRWVLGAWKIPTERADAILPRLQTVVARFGAPCAVVRDLGRAMTEAARDLVGSPDQHIPVLACHFHFLKDVGKDLLTESHDDLRTLFRRFEVMASLRALARDLGRNLGAELEPSRHAVVQWLETPTDAYQLPGGQTGVGVVRAIAQWVLDYPRDGQDEGFPFDLPWLDLYRRCRRACRATEAFLRSPGQEAKSRKLLERLHRILDPVRSQLPFAHRATVLEARARLFTELRGALRLKDEPSPSAAAPPQDVQDQVASLRDIEAAVDALTGSLRERRPERGPAQDMRRAIDLILVHLERHGPSLWGHVIARAPSAGGGVRLVDRTNLLLEGFWHELKHAERRRSGRKILTHDLELLPAAATLAFNLTRSDYVAIVCGNLEQLPRAFARIDAEDRQRSLPARTRAAHLQEAGEPDIVSASLPAADRHIIRMDAMKNRIGTAARSRAPRRQVQL